MSEQTATRGMPAPPRALELRPPREATRRARPERRRTDRPPVDRRRLDPLRRDHRPGLRPGADAHRGCSSSPRWRSIAGYAAAGLYSQGAPRPREELAQILSVSALVIMGLAGIELAFGRQDIGDTAVRFWLLAATMTGAGRITVNGTHALMRRGVSLAAGNTLIVGAGRVGHLAAKRLLDDPALGMRPIGFLDKDPLRVEPTPDSEPVPTLPVLGASYDLEQVVARPRRRARARRVLDGAARTSCSTWCAAAGRSACR